MKFLAKKQKGFTLIELMVSIFIFLIIVALVIEIFGKQVVVSRHARILQRNIDDAEFAMNYLAKTLRTSTLPTSPEGEDGSANQNLGTAYVQTLYAYDYSQGKCFKFAFEDDSLIVYSVEGNVVQEKYDSGGATEKVEINRGNLFVCAYDNNYTGDGMKLTSGKVTGSFYMTPTREDADEVEGEPEVYHESMGKVTVTLEIDNRFTEAVEQGGEDGNGGAQNMVVIQTSVSLRDYPSDITF